MKKQVNTDPINYNSMELSTEKIFLYLHQGKRIPQNDKERRFLKHCKEIEESGGVVELPHGDMV